MTFEFIRKIFAIIGLICWVLDGVIGFYELSNDNGFNWNIATFLIMMPILPYLLTLAELV